MAWCFGDGFDLYAAQADLLAGYWDSGTAIGNLTASPNGRFTVSQAISWVSSSGGNVWVKSSGVNDGVHHFNVAFFQTATVSGSNVGFYLQLTDNVTNQCCRRLSSGWSDPAAVWSSRRHHACHLHRRRNSGQHMVHVRNRGRDP